MIRALPIPKSPRDGTTSHQQGQDVIQQLIDSFWDFPLAFLYFVHFQYQEEMIDLFAGRIYGEHILESEGVQAFRRLLASKAN